MPLIDAELQAIETAVAAKETELAEQSTRLADLEARETALGERESTTRRAAAQTTIDPHVEAGRLLPRQEAGMIALCEYLTADADGKNKTQGSVDLLDDFLAGLPEQVDYSERSAPDGDSPPASAGMTVPAGVELGETEMHDKVMAHVAKHGGTYIEAVQALGNTLFPNVRRQR